MKNNGFTLIETLVAIFLLTVGTVGSFSLMQQATSFASIASSQFVASYLAQEGIEIIRNIRDANYLNGRNWDDYITEGTGRLSYSSIEFPDTICDTYLQHNGSFYICSDTGKFQREITVIKSVEPEKMVVSVVVSWSERGAEHSVSAETELYKWR